MMGISRLLLKPGFELVWWGEEWGICFISIFNIMIEQIGKEDIPTSFVDE